MPVSFWNDPDRSKYHAAYFDKYPNVWRHGDWCELTEHEGMIIYGRSDATLNPGGVRIGTAEIYRQVEQLPEILESVAIGRRSAMTQRATCALSCLCDCRKECSSMKLCVRRSEPDQIEHESASRPEENPPGG
jgi:acyl-coenzyme A synthetase/AMP-(fatty) acid ligase